MFYKIEIPVGMGIVPVEIQGSGCKGCCFEKACRSGVTDHLPCSPGNGRDDGKSIIFKFINVEAMYKAIGKNCNTCIGCELENNNSGNCQSWIFNEAKYDNKDMGGKS